MTDALKTIDLIKNEGISDRDVSLDRSSYGIHIEQLNGSYAVVEPYNVDGSCGGRILIFPQSPKTGYPIELQAFDRVGRLYYPRDAKFDYTRKKIWIADTGNNRVLKVDLNSFQVELNIDEGLIYPYALAVDLNTGGIFIKGYRLYDLNYGIVHYFKKEGTLLSTFSFDHASIESSSSSISSSQTTSESSDNCPPEMPSNRSIIFDSSRSRVWWVDGVKIYMADIRNQQVQSYDVRSDNFYAVTTIDVELSTGNAFVTAQDIHGEWAIMQMFRDNNKFLGSAYVGE